MTTSTEKLRAVCEFSFRCSSTADVKPVIAPITLHSTGSYDSAVGTFGVAARCCVWHLSPQTQKGVSVQEQRPPKVVEPRSVRQTGITRRRITPVLSRVCLVGTNFSAFSLLLHHGVSISPHFNSCLLCMGAIGKFQQQADRRLLGLLR